MRKFAIWSLAVAASFLMVRAGVAEEQASRIGRKIENFELHDYRGKQRSLDEFRDSKFVVVAFVGVECPLAKLYAPRLQELSKEFADKGVSFIAIDSNRQDSLTEIGAYARIHSVEFPVLKDTNNVVADAFDAVRTPEVFVLDQERVVRYWGRIDDQYGFGSGAGYAKPQIRRRDLAVALEELLAGKPVSQASIEAGGCFIGRVSEVKPHGDVTYTNQIARLMQSRCVECHRPGEIAPFSLTDYQEVVGWAETMVEVVDQNRMPPWFANPEVGHFQNDVRLTAQEKSDLHEWVKNGCPEGDPAELPEPRQFTEGWQMEKPDAVVYMSEKPYTVQAEGVVEYQYFTVDPGWTEGKWIQAAEARPGNRSVVHHIIVFVQPPRDPSQKGRGSRRGGGSVGGYAPGEGYRLHPEGVAQYVPAGSKFIFQMHYTPNGSEQQDHSYIGFKFADPTKVKRTARGVAALNNSFEIPPGEGNHEVKSRYRFRRDTLVSWFLPHMHLRGKSFKYEAKYPDGTSEVLLDVPRYDFNWQLRYELAEPKLMPKGTVVYCTAHFDNSEDNLANPDPTETVRWGDQTFEEMMIGFMGGHSPEEDVTKDGPIADASEEEGEGDDDGI